MEVLSFICEYPWCEFWSSGKTDIGDANSIVHGVNLSAAWAQFEGIRYVRDNEECFDFMELLTF